MGVFFFNFKSLMTLFLVLLLNLPIDSEILFTNTIHTIDIKYFLVSCFSHLNFFSLPTSIGMVFGVHLGLEMQMGRDIWF